MKIFVSTLTVLLAIFAFSDNFVIIDYDPGVIDDFQRNSFVSEFSDQLMSNGIYNINVLRDDSIMNYWNNMEEIKVKTAQWNPDNVIIFKYYVFGDNFVVKLTQLDMHSLTVIRNEAFSLEEPEELKTVAQKAGLMVSHDKSIDQLQEVGLLIPNEQKEILEKRSQGLTGLSFNAGYMWALTDDGYAGAYKKVLLLSASLPIEVSTNGRLDITADLMVAASIAATIGYSHIMKPTSVTPYWGADAGIEYVYHRADMFPNNSLGGIIIRPKFGYMIMNTYKASVYVEAAYRFVTNDFFDRGIEFRFGCIFR